VRSLLALGRADATRITRDPFLIFMVTYPWIMAVVLNRVLPWLSARFADRFALTAYYPMAACLVAVLVPYSMGLVLGFQLLEEKDERSLVAVSVTPLSLDHYVLYRTTLYGLVSLPLVVLLHELLAVVAVPTGAIAVVAVAATPMIPLMALVIAGFASNQVEGFAVMKGGGFLLVGPLVSFLVPRHWDLLFGVLPTYWPIEAYYAAAEGSTFSFWAAAVTSLVYPTAWIVVLYRRFRRQAMAS
jgi:fluoroquinolone transport system permease protein